MEWNELLNMAPWLIIIGGLYCFCVFVAYTRTELALMAAISSVPFYNFIVIRTPAADFRLPFILWTTLFFVLILKKEISFKNLKVKLPEFIVPLAFLIGAYLISLFNSFSPIITIRESIQIAYLASIIVCITIIIKDKKTLMKINILIGFCLSIFVMLGLSAFVLKYVPIPHLDLYISPGVIDIDIINTDTTEQLKAMGVNITRASSCYLGPVGTASFLLPFIVFTCCQALLRFDSLRLWQKTLFGIVFIGAALLLVLTYSRAAWVILGLLIILLLIIAWNRKVSVFMAVLFAAVLLLVPNQEAVVARSKETINPTQEASFRGHVTMSQAATEMFLKSPLVGNGAGYFKEKITEVYPDYKHQTDAHNFILQSMAETGLVGLACLIWFLLRYLITLFKGLKSSLNTDRITILGCLLTGVGTMLMNLTMNGFMVEFFWVVLGIGFASAKVLTKGENFS